MPQKPVLFKLPERGVTGMRSDFHNAIDGAGSAAAFAYNARGDVAEVTNAAGNCQATR